VTESAKVAIDESKFDESQRRTIEIYRQICEERDRQIAERARRVAAGEVLEAPTVRRLRFTRDPKTGKAAIDLSKADPNCTRCGGSGRRADEVLSDPEKGDISIPVVCSCVHRRGGITPDLLDKAIKRAEGIAKMAAARRARSRAKGTRRRSRQKRKR